MASARDYNLSAEGVAAFLSSSFVDGIGPVYARRLTEAFGTDALRVLTEAPEEAEAVPGIGALRVSSAAESLKALPVPPCLYAFLFSCGLGESAVESIVKKYKKKTEERVFEDPYSMVEDVWKFSFFSAEKIGRQLGIRPEDPRRLQAALVAAVKHFAEAGHLFARPDEATEYATSISGVSPEAVRSQIPAVLSSGRLVESRGNLYIPVFYAAEKEGARKLADLASAPASCLNEDAVPAVDSAGRVYTSDQRDAILRSLNSPVSVLTGGPGSGKTTVLRGFIDYLEKEGKKVILAAPTGRAAKRMSTLTGREAATIHRLLGYRQGEGYRTRKIEADVLVIDEGSMMEQVLFNHLLQALRPGVKILLVGDVDQLPAIGAGDVLRDMIDSGSIPVSKLVENFRQGEGSTIATGAGAINSGRVPESDPEGDFSIVHAKGTREIHDRVMALVSEEIPEQRGITPGEITVVTPQQIGPLGARQLNIDLQNRLNPEGPELRRGATIMRLSDPVMQTANSSERGVYNGETGRIVDVDTANQELTVEFSDGRRSDYKRSELGELTLAYATTVHKLQGSEVRYMVFPITMTHKPMLYRNLLYTGVSRASRLCVLVGEEEALKYAVTNSPDSTRNSNFGSRLKKYIERNQLSR